MASIPHSDGRVRLVRQSAVGTAATSFPASSQIRTEPTGPPQTPREALSGDLMTLGFAAPEVTAGAMLPEPVSLVGPVQGLAAAALSADPTDGLPEAMLADLALGGQAFDGYQTDLVEASGGSTTTKIGVTSAAGQTLGVALLVPLAAGGHSVGWVTAIDTDATPNTITVTALSGAPATTGTVYGSHTAYQSASLTDDPLTLEWMGPEDDDRIRIVDCYPERLMFDLSPGEGPRYECDLRGFDAVRDGTGGGPSSEDPARPVVPPVLVNSRLVIDGAVVCVERTVLTITPTQVARRCHGKTTGRSGADRSGLVVELELDTRVTADHLITSAPGTEPGYIQIDAAVTPGRALSVLARRPRLMSEETIEDVDGMVVHRAVYRWAAPVATAGTPLASPGAIGWM